MDQEHLQIRMNGRDWSKKESEDLQTEKCWRSTAEKVSRRALAGKRMGG